MSKSQETWNKKEREKKKQKSRQDKQEKKQERKDNAKEGGKSFDDMLAYIDENGNLSSTPPDPLKKKKIKLEDIQIGTPKQAPSDPAELIRTGIVTFFNESKGYGFIKDQQTQESIFVHANGLLNQIKENNKVIFEVEMGPKGPTAVRVKLTQ